MDDESGASCALRWAEQVGHRASELGFDWPEVDGPLAKVREELDELRAAIDSGDAQAVEAELGDLLFSVTNVARHLRVSSAEALEGCVRRFERRFAEVEASLAAEGRAIGEAPLDELEAHWQAAKRRVG